MNTKHTAGPWTHCNNIPCGYGRSSEGYVGADGEIAFICNPSEGEYAVAVPPNNVAVLAAAPELLEALQACLWMIEQHEGTSDLNDRHVDEARAAIARATGEGA